MSEQDGSATGSDAAVASTADGSLGTGDTPAPVNWIVFIGASIGIIAIALWAILAPEQAQLVLTTVVAWISHTFGWFYVLLAALILVFVIFLAMSRYGRIRLGPENSQPQFSTFTWASMLFAAGIGTDLMFFAVAEPVTQYLQPPSGPGETVEAAREATAWTIFHYGVSGWAMYALMGMAMGYFAYRMRLTLAVRSALRPVFGRRIDGGLGDAVDLAAVLGTIFGVATTLGIGAVMINAGLSVLFGVPRSIGVQLIVVVIGVVAATVSAVSGVGKGIRRLSEINVFLVIVLGLWVLLAGKTQYLMDALMLNIGDFFRLFPDMVLQTFAFEDTGTWMSDWTLFFWAWWIAWASFVGLFLARISRGRTIREFVGGTLIIPFVYILMWISIYGNSAIDLIRSGNHEFGQDTLADPEGGFYALLQQYPGFAFIAGLATLTALLFYVTSADSAALVMANLTSKLPTPRHDGRPLLRVFWAAVTGLLTVAMLLVGGVGALQSATVIMGLPFGFAMIAVMLGLHRALRAEMIAPHPARIGSLDPRPREEWKTRLAQALTFPDVPSSLRYEEETLRPALHTIVEEFAWHGIDAEIQDSVDDEGQHIIELLVNDDDVPFRYRVHRRALPLPAFAGGAVHGAEEYIRLEVRDPTDGRNYDITGYGHDELLDDVLGQYERRTQTRGRS